MLVFFASLLFAAPKNPAILSPVLVQHAEAASITFSTSTLQAFASSTAAAAGLDPVRFQAVINCESGWNPDAIGDDGTSIGIAQVHYPSRDWRISTSTALNPFQAISVMADAWGRG